MDYEKLCEELRHYGTTYGTSLGLHMGIMDVAADTIEKLQAKYEEAARNFQQENAECRKLQAENERLKAAVDAAVADIMCKDHCDVCAHSREGNCNCEAADYECQYCTDEACTCRGCRDEDHWQWRGLPQPPERT